MKRHPLPWVLVVLTGLVPAAVGGQFTTFAEYRYGLRTHGDPGEKHRTLNEMRVQLDGSWYGDLLTGQVKLDLVYDDLMEDRHEINLETGQGLVDLRQAYLVFSPLDFMDVKVGRQVLTWGTGDLVFLNDLFPKDWQSFFLGRDEEYLKAPSDALFLSLFPSWANLDIAYTPCFDADRYISGERLSYWGGAGIVGRNAPVRVDRPNRWFTDDELAVRLYRTIGSSELALYGYRGFWKSPRGFDPERGLYTFPRLAVYGASWRGNMLGGLAYAEAAYYDSRDDRRGNNAFVPNSESRLLLGYERELVRDFTIGVQYYLEHMMDFDEYLESLQSVEMDTGTARDQDRHTLTLRLTQLLFQQKLILSCFTRFSPSDDDAYIKPVVTYKADDHLTLFAGGNFFVGERDYTFLYQFHRNNNVYAGVRVSF